ncbi:hypothetical protein ACJVC5_15565 [Peredibacter sp. HCB2-198]|uniref:hypothetical protein n=1 Tax=Peredibacter sp. HCB2-198 TaxID=3383025 RepID=UPI0038B48A0B
MPQLLLFMACFWSTFTVAETYSLADLEVLANEGSHYEFFQHALDIRPSERQEAWKTMVSKMGDQYSRSVLSKSEINRKDFHKIESLYDWPSLKSDDVFKVRRQEIGQRFLRACLKGDNPCWNDLKAFWEKDKTDPEVSFKLAELTSIYKESPLSSWSFLEVALKSNLSEFYCKKEFVMTALWGKIEIDYIKLGPEGDLMTKIDHTIHPDCMPSLILEARKRLFSPPKMLDRELAFQILKSQTKADSFIQDFFYTVYLLDNPSQGELFNYSWNRLRELAQKSNRRDAVMKKMRELDPLPDGILASLDERKKRAILNHFKMYFPEYLNFYTDQCVLFYGGKGSFPTGNPTVNCQQFMDSELAPSIIDDFKIKQYQDVRKI